jgi:PPE-repeat protein
MESPLPANLNEEQVAQVKVSLAEMAKPFQDKVESLKKLMETEEQKVSLSLTQSSSKPSFDENSYQEAINLLHQNPKNGAALTQLKTLFTNAGLNRPAAYFEGRIQGL